MREKLIELLYNLPTPEPVVGIRAGKKLMTAGFVADHLIANGVTFATDTNVGSKWIPVAEQLPPSLDDVLVWYEYRVYDGSGGLSKHKIKEYGIGCYIASLDAWSKDPGRGNDVRVIAWMPLPEPPKECE